MAAAPPPLLLPTALLPAFLLLALSCGVADAGKNDKCETGFADRSWDSFGRRCYIIDIDGKQKDCYFPFEAPDMENPRLWAWFDAYCAPVPEGIEVAGVVRAPMTGYDGGQWCMTSSFWRFDGQSPGSPNARGEGINWGEAFCENRTIPVDVDSRSKRCSGCKFPFKNPENGNLMTRCIQGRAGTGVPRKGWKDTDEWCVTSDMGYVKGDAEGTTWQSCKCEDWSPSPTSRPTRPTPAPSTAQPSEPPSSSPSARPTPRPTARPTMVPSPFPSRSPTRSPSTAKPSADPTSRPSLRPTPASKCPYTDTQFGCQTHWCDEERWADVCARTCGTEPGCGRYKPNTTSSPSPQRPADGANGTVTPPPTSPRRSDPPSGGESERVALIALAGVVGGVSVAVCALVVVHRYRIKHRGSDADDKQRRRSARCGSTELVETLETRQVSIRKIVLDLPRRRPSSSFRHSPGNRRSTAVAKHRSELVKESFVQDSWFVPFENLKLGRKVAAGGSGQVFKGKFSRHNVAIKELFATLIDGSNVEEFRREASVLSGLHHPHIVTFFGISQNEASLYIITEWCPGSVAARIEKGDISTQQALIWGAELAGTMSFLHDKNICHRDLKPDNLLLSATGSIKLCDFGMAKKMKKRMTQMIGTPAFMAPELLGTIEGEGGKKSLDARKLDVYSFSVVLNALFANKHPYANLSPMRVIAAVKLKGLRPEIAESLPQECRAIVKMCWHEKPELRPNFREVSAVLVQMRRLFLSQGRMMLMRQQSSEGSSMDAI